jgi:zinc/manganese transport system substrate-binding protein
MYMSKSRVRGFPGSRVFLPFALVSLAVIVLLFASSCTSDRGSPGAGGSARNGLVKVVAAENFWGDVVSQIGAGHVSAKSIIASPSADPHLYESTANDAAAVSTAKIVVLNGAGYDDFMNRLLSSSGTHPIVVSVQKVMRAGGANPNPHFWYEISKVPDVAGAIETALENADPKNAAAYRSNLGSFDASLQPVMEVINLIKARYKGAPVAYTERVPGYLLNEAGLRVVSPPGFAQAIEDGNDPGPADASAMNDLITSRKIRMLLYNRQAVSPVTQRVRSLALKYGVPVVGITETLPRPGEHYQQWQLDQTRAILKALGG